MLSKPTLPFTFICTAVVLLQDYDCAKSTSRGRHSLNPEFWLGRYKIINRKLVSVATDFIHSTFEDDFISKNESDYIIFEDVMSVLLICEAKYPIEVKFLHPEELPYPSSVHIRTVSERISEFNEDLDEPQNQGFVFYTSIEFENAKFFSSTLICQSIENSAINSSIHVYKLGQFSSHLTISCIQLFQFILPTFVLTLILLYVIIFISHQTIEAIDAIERQGETIQISVDAKTPLQVELPCRPANPTASVTLQKQTQTTVCQNEQYDNVPIWSDFKWSSFDPKIGFTLTLPKSQIYFDSIPPPVSLFGLYKCSIGGGDDDQFVFVNVTRKSADQTPNDPTFQTKFILRENATAGRVSTGTNHLPDRDNGFYKCCTGVPYIPPIILGLPCETTLECDIHKAMLIKIEKHIASTSSSHRTSVPRESLNNISYDCALIALYGGSTIYYKLISTTSEKQTKTNKPQITRTSNHPVKEQDNDHEPLSLARNVGVNRKIGISIGKPIPENWHWRMMNRKLNKIWRSTRTAFTNLLYSLNPPESISKLQTITILEVEDKTKDVYEGESIYCMCFSLSMFHSGGGYLRINWKNGTNLVLEEAEYSTAIIEASAANSIHFSGLDAFGINPTIAKLIEADMEMTSVECFQPVWNSSRWENIKIEIEVHASLKPVFSGASDEIMYVNMNETGHEIVCELVQGKPPPETITVTKDKVPITARMNIQPVQANTTTYTPLITRTVININPDVDNIVIIKLPAISYESHGVYACTAENGKGKAVKTVRLIVVGKQDV
ncbi:unnamed protein product [Orchesella dallaii]|uniref:Ig-like domain-containing protein n=1 Tax=Orchesella dallaii TaxID=48710 RepID=A0ABP1PMG2_9HEXA